MDVSYLEARLLLLSNMIEHLEQGNHGKAAKLAKEIEILDKRHLCRTKHLIALQESVEDTPPPRGRLDLEGDN